MADVGLEEIEAAAIAFVKANWPAGAKPIVDFDVSADPMNISTPGLYAAAQYTSIVRQTGGLYTGIIKLGLIVLDSNLKGSMARRAAIHKLTLAIIKLLQKKTLGLAIKGLVPFAAPEITDAELRAANKLGFRIDFKTEADITEAPEDDSSDLVTIAGSFYLDPEKAGTDAEPDIVEEVTVGTPPPENP